MEHFNQIAFSFVHSWTGQSGFFDWVGIFLAEYLAYFMVAGFLVFAYYQKGLRRKFYLFAEGAIAVMLARGLVTEFIRLFYHHERPFSFYHFIPLIPEVGWSFPSGHMAWFFALAMVLWYTNRKWGWWYFVLTALMGVARIYVGVHWPYDVIAGAAVGIFSAMAVHRLLKSTRQAIEIRSVPLSTAIPAELAHK